MNFIKYWKKTPLDDKAFDIFAFVSLFIAAILVMYPLYFVVIASFSDPVAVNSGKVWFWIKDLTLEGYKIVFADDLIWKGYANSLFYTSTGTLISILFTITAGYALSREDLYGKKIYLFLFVFTMFFSGGMIPKYMLVSQLGWINSPMSMIFADAINVFNMIIARSFFKSSLPDSILEASKIDGCNDFQYFIKIVLPLSKPLIAIMVLFYALGMWNSWFNAMIYLTDEKKYTLNLMLRNILVKQNMNLSSVTTSNIDNLLEQQRIAELVKYVVIIVSSLPVLIIYPYIQKYFVKGVMIGSVKG